MSEAADPRERTLNCATCHGQVLVNGRWIPTRRTIGMVCPDCRWDYAQGEPPRGTLRP